VHTKLDSCGEKENGAVLPKLQTPGADRTDYLGSASSFLILKATAKKCQTAPALAATAAWQLQLKDFDGRVMLICFAAWQIKL
jgi:hypothetical protein